MPLPVKQNAKTQAPVPFVTPPLGLAAPPSGGVMSRLLDLGSSLDQTGVKLLVYGKSGTGKTTFWATFPGRILCVLCSGGIKPGELRSIDTPANRKRIQSVVLKESGELRDVATYIKLHRKFDAVILDHISGLQDLVLKEVLVSLGKLPVDGEVPVQKSWGLATQQEYGQCTQQCKELIRPLLDLDQNVVIVAQERMDNSESNSELIEPSISPAVLPSLGLWLGPACDYVVQTFLKHKEETRQTTIGKGKDAKVITTKHLVSGVDYCMRTLPDGIRSIKFRIPHRGLPEYIVNPNYHMVMKLIKEGKL